MKHPEGETNKSSDNTTAWKTKIKGRARRLSDGSGRIMRSSGIAVRLEGCKQKSLSLAVQLCLFASFQSSTCE